MQHFKYGPNWSFSVACGFSAKAGRATAEAVVADAQVVGVIGTLCSGAAVEASPVLSAAGLSMISPSNTSPVLTSDLAGNAGPHHHKGYGQRPHRGEHRREIYKVDRLTRSLTDFARIIETFDARGVSFVSVTDGPETAPVDASSRCRWLSTQRIS